MRIQAMGEPWVCPVGDTYAFLMPESEAVSS